MSHAKSLRVIGQSLESAQIATFELEKYGPDYMLWTDSVNETREQFLRNLLNHSTALAREHFRSPKRVFCFTTGSISRLDALAQKQRRHQSSSGGARYKLISRGLRNLGDQLDRMQASAFRIEWDTIAVIVDYQRVDGARGYKKFTFEELHQFCLQPKMRRSSLYLLPPLDP